MTMDITEISWCSDLQTTTKSCTVPSELDSRHGVNSGTLFTADRKGPCNIHYQNQGIRCNGMDNLTIPIEEQVKDNVATPAEIDDIT